MIIREISKDEIVPQLRADIDEIIDCAKRVEDKVITLGSIALVSVSGLGLMVDLDDRKSALIYRNRKVVIPKIEDCGDNYLIIWRGICERLHNALKITDEYQGDITVIPNYKINKELKELGV